MSNLKVTDTWNQRVQLPWAGGERLQASTTEESPAMHRGHEGRQPCSLVGEGVGEVGGGDCWTQS